MDAKERIKEARQQFIKRTDLLWGEMIWELAQELHMEEDDVREIADDI